MARLLWIRRCAAAFESALVSSLAPVRLPPPLHPLAELKSVARSGSPPLRPPLRQPCSFSETTARSHSPPPPFLQHECSSAWEGSLQRPSPAPLQPCDPSVTAARSRPPLPPLLGLRHEFSSSSAVGSLQRQSAPSLQACAQSKTSSSRLLLPPSLHQQCSRTAARTCLVAAPPSSRWPSNAGARRYSSLPASFMPGRHIIHSGSQWLHRELPYLQEHCIGEDDFHLYFDPRDYVRIYPPLQPVLIPGLFPYQYILMAVDHGVILIRSLPKFLNSMHESGVCLSPATPLTLNNLAVSSDGKFRVRLDLVRFVPLGGSEGGSIANDYYNASEVLAELLESSPHGKNAMKNLRKDMDRWFSLLRSCITLDDAYLVCNHSSLLPKNNISDVFMKLYKCIRDDIDETSANNILSRVPLDYGPDPAHKEWWYTIAANTKALKPWYEFRTYGETIEELFNLHRNCFCHKESGSVNICLLLYMLYEDFLSKTQESVWKEDHRLLRTLKLHENFPG